MPPFWYRAAWALARALAPLAPGDAKLARAMRGRAAAAGRLASWAAAHRDPDRTLLWMHAASVGEGRQAEAVLLRLRAARPAWQLVYTFLSPSAERLAASLPVDFAGYIPADTPAEAGRALDAVRPDALCFSATDVWPELVHQAARRGTRLALVSANLAARSSRLGPGERALLRGAYTALDAVGAIDADDAARLVGLGVAADRVEVTGDARHDAAHARAAGVDRRAPHLRALAAGPADPRPIVVAGSTWPADERRLLAAAGDVLRTGTPLRLVVAPHEPGAGHISALRDAAAALPGKVRVRTLTELEAATLSAGSTEGWDVCLVDRVGVLAELYAAAAVAYVGGGFGRAGLHSVIEPAALGVPVLFGPRLHRSRDARLLLDAGGGLRVGDAAALERAAREWLGNEAARAAAGAAARAVVDRGRGAAQRSVGLLLELLERPAE